MKHHPNPMGFRALFRQGKYNRYTGTPGAQYLIAHPNGIQAGTVLTSIDRKTKYVVSEFGALVRKN